MSVLFLYVSRIPSAGISLLFIWFIARYRGFIAQSRVFTSLPRVSSLGSPVFTLVHIKKLGSRRVMPSFDFAIGLNGCPAAINYELCACHEAGFF